MNCTFAAAFALVGPGRGPHGRGAGSERPPTAVAAPFPVTWTAVERIVKGEPNNGGRDLLSHAIASRRGQCRTSGFPERELVENIRSRAEKEAKKD